MYEGEFPDGNIQKYDSNIIAKNMIMEVDSEGFSTSQMEGIIDYEKNEAKPHPRKKNR